MNQNSKLLPAILVVGGFAVLFLLLGFLISREFNRQQNGNLEGVAISHEYTATSTRGVSGANLGKVTCSPLGDIDHLVAYNKYAGTTLGSVTVVSSTAHQLKIKNATTTSATGFYANSSSTIATLSANLPQGTYVFDAYLDKGLVLDFEAGFCGDYVITYR